MSEIRLDKISEQYVIIAPERLRRPNNIGFEKQQKTPKNSCPFCDGNEYMTPKEIFAIRHNDTLKWHTRVIPNLYKAVQIESGGISKREGIFESVPGLGAHEIIIDTPCHECNIQDLDDEAVRKWLQTIIARIEDLKKDHRLIYLNIFKNVGQEAGATQEHPHTQLIALPVMPKDEVSFLSRNMAYYQRHGRGIIEDILYNETASKDRIITDIGTFVAFCPYASSFPFEVMIAPKQNIWALNRCTKQQLDELSIVIKSVFRKLTKQLGEFDYNLAFIQAPLNQNFENKHYMQFLDENYRFILRIIPRIYNIAGFELSSGMTINCIEPEECARLLRGDEI